MVLWVESFCDTLSPVPRSHQISSVSCLGIKPETVWPVIFSLLFGLVFVVVVAAAFSPWKENPSGVDTLGNV